jgi:hypothetical protein
MTCGRIYPAKETAAFWGLILAAFEQLKTSSSVILDRVQSGKLIILGAYYDLDTGKVELLKP